MTDIRKLPAVDQRAETIDSLSKEEAATVQRLAWQCIFGEVQGADLRLVHGIAELLAARAAGIRGSS